MIQKLEPTDCSNLTETERLFITSILNFITLKSEYYKKLLNNIDSEDNATLAFDLKSQYSAYDSVSLYISQLVNEFKNNDLLIILNNKNTELNNLKLQLEKLQNNK